jgi:Lon protease-like protein
MVSIPELIPVFPLPEVVLLPGEVLPLHIFETRYRNMVRDALGGHRVIGMVEYDTSGVFTKDLIPPICALGCAGFIAEHKELDDGRYLLWLLGLERFSIDEEISVDTLYRQARVTYTPINEDTGSLASLLPVRRELQRVLPQLVELDEEDRLALTSQMSEITDSQLIALACQILELPADRKRELLQADNQVDRFMLVFDELYRHLDDHPNVDGASALTLN